MEGYFCLFHRKGILVLSSKNSFKVDIITGATNSSKTILKTVQNGLDSGVKD